VITLRFSEMTLREKLFWMFAKTLFIRHGLPNVRVFIQKDLESLLAFASYVILEDRMRYVACFSRSKIKHLSWPVLYYLILHEIAHHLAPFWHLGADGPNDSQRLESQSRHTQMWLCEALRIGHGRVLAERILTQEELQRTYPEMFGPVDPNSIFTLRA
jgi:hypothetical protein